MNGHRLKQSFSFPNLNFTGCMSGKTKERILSRGFSSRVRNSSAHSSKTTENKGRFQPRTRGAGLERTRSELQTGDDEEDLVEVDLIERSLTVLKTPGVSTANMAVSYHTPSASFKESAAFEYLCQSGTSKVNMLEVSESELDSLSLDDSPAPVISRPARTFAPRQRNEACKRKDRENEDFPQGKKARSANRTPKVGGRRGEEATTDLPCDLFDEEKEKNRAEGIPTHQIGNRFRETKARMNGGFGKATLRVSSDGESATFDRRSVEEASPPMGHFEEARNVSEREDARNFLSGDFARKEPLAMENFVYYSKSVFSKLYEAYGNKLSKVYKDIEAQANIEWEERNRRKRAASLANKSAEGTEGEDPGFARESSENENEDDEEFYGKDRGRNFLEALSRRNVPKLRRKDVIFDFLRPAVAEAGERPCVNGGEKCVSVEQFRQKWAEDRVAMQKNWHLEDRDGNIYDMLSSSGVPYRPEPLREFLCPSQEKKRKELFAKALVDFLESRDPHRTAISQSPSGPRFDSQPRFGRNENEENFQKRQQELDAWFRASADLVNPPVRGYCILCYLRLRSELAAVYSAENLAADGNDLEIGGPLLVQHHSNVFGIPGEYKPGCQIVRGSKLCGLVAPAFEYRVGNYLPSLCQVECKTLIPARVGSSRKGEADATIGAGGFELGVRTFKNIRQWSEVDDVVCKPEDVISDVRRGA